MQRRRRFAMIWLLLGAGAADCGAADVLSPEAHLGYRPGADFHLVGWPTVVDYVQKVDRASDRVLVRELGRTTEGRPYLVAIVSAEETIRDLDRYREWQRKLADPRLFASDDEARQAVARGKVVVVITCSIHSTETASTFMAMELLHELATRDDPATREILNSTIVLLVPSANPDGVDKVARWYERSKGKPWEGDGMPELYHAFAGHDTNRDWFMLNLKETQLLTRLLYKEWFPTLLYDIHQMGGRGARIFVPPFFDPINPNLDPRLHQSIFTIGAHMAGDLAAEGRRGVLFQALYDNWWNGGNRTTPQRHNIVAVLTESASVKMASPIFVAKDDLRGLGRGFPSHRPAVNFVDPWPGGWWRLRDIVDDERICARSLLTLAARYRERFQSDLLAMARRAIARGIHEPPMAWIVPRDQRDPGTAAELVRILNDTGIEVQRAQTAFQAGGASYPPGIWILPASQPYRAHLMDMMERQVYPSRFTAEGAAEPPYDVAGWTLPLQMGVRAVAVTEPFKAEVETLSHVEPIRGGIEGAGPAEFFTIRNQANDDFIVLNALLAAGVEVEVLTTPVVGARPIVTAGTLRFRADARTKAVLDAVLPTVSTRVVAESGPAPLAANLVKVLPQRIGVYQPWVPSIDEGWTRLVLERFRFRYVTLHNAEVRAGDLKGRVDVLLIPSIEAKTLRGGFAVDETEPRYVGGLGQEGTAALRAFVREGGTLVCLEDSCEFAIDELGLPVANALKGLKNSEFYGPGSVVRVVGSFPDLLTLGVPSELCAVFDHSLAFNVTKPEAARVALRYAAVHPLESGWLLGPEKLQDKAALVEVPQGRGRIILFAFPPQYRGQPHATFRLLFNALLRGGMSPAH